MPLARLLPIALLGLVALAAVGPGGFPLPGVGALPPLGPGGLAPARAEGESAAEQMLERLAAAPLPPRDPVDLAVRLRGVDPARAYGAPAPAAPRCTGQEDTFWIVDQRSAQTFETRATLRLITGGTDASGCALDPAAQADADRAAGCDPCAHTYWYVQTDRGERVADAELRRSASTFEFRTYPAVRRSFGAEPSPGVDGDTHLVFVLADVPGVAAYFSGVDAYPRAVNPRSNERDAIYVNLDVLRPGQPGFDATLAHEFQHMVHFARCPIQETWVDEGAAELASRLAGYGLGQLEQFAARPDVQLTAWTNQPAEYARHYQAAYLFLLYAVERYGGPDMLPELLGRCERGASLFARFLEGRGLPGDVHALIADWAVANLLNDRSVGDGRYGYERQPLRTAVTAAVTRDGPLNGAAPQDGPSYVELPTGGGTLSFLGQSSVPLLPTLPPSGRSLWWSNRADSLDSRLTRRLDLRGVASATARFRAWYDLEEHFDFVYLLASRDGGSSWQTLPGRYTVPDTAVGNSFGVGWTGASGGGERPRWVEEEVDLTPLAGAEVLLRFEYLTDQGYNARGFAFDDLQLPELGLTDDAETDGDWLAEGWVRVDAPVPERWQLRLLRWTRQGAHVDAIPVGADGQATVPLDPAATRQVLVVVPSALRTLQPASFSLVVRG